MAINNKNIVTRVKPQVMTDAAWRVELATKTATQLSQYDVTTSAFCCDDAIQACVDHDADVPAFRALKQAIRAKVQASGIGSLTVSDIAPLLWKLCQLLEKNMEKAG